MSLVSSGGGEKAIPVQDRDPMQIGWQSKFPTSRSAANVAKQWLNQCVIA